MSEQAHLWPDGYYRTTPPDPSSQERRLWLEALIAERDRLREALEFYADGDWNERYPCGVWYDHDEAIIDFGQVARAALREEK